MNYLTDVKWIVKYRNTPLNSFFRIFRHLVSGKFYIPVIIIGYLMDERRYFYRDLSFLLSIALNLNSCIKLFFKVERPNSKYYLKGIEIYDRYSFPSGDAQMQTMFVLMMMEKYRNINVWCSGILLIVFTAFSRVYLGVHTLIDVICGFLVGAMMYIIYKFIYLGYIDDYETIWLDYRFITIVVSVYFVCYLFIYANNYIYGYTFYCIGWTFGLIVGNYLYFHYVGVRVKEWSFVFYYIITLSLLGVIMRYGNKSNSETIKFLTGFLCTIAGTFFISKSYLMLFH